MSTDIALRTHLAEVRRAAPLTPGVRRITFAGEDLATYEPLGPDQFLYLMLPPPGRDELTIGRDFDWISFYLMPEEDRPVGAHYTVRHHRPDDGEIDVDFVLHDHPGDVSGWALTAEPGNPVALWGPRTAYQPPADVDSYLLVADETGLPAVAAILEHLAGEGFTGPVRVVAEVADAGEHQPLPVGRDGEIAWLHRDGVAAGLSTQLLDTITARPLLGEVPYVWGGGESRTMTAIRKHVRHTVGLPRTHVSLTPYWRHALHADDPDDQETDT